MTIELRNLITYNPMTVQVEDTLESILESSPCLPYHHWPVVDDERRLVGVLSEQDLINALSQRFALATAGGAAESCMPFTTQVGEIMTRDVLTVGESTSVDKALALMLQRRVHCLPVMSDGRMVAILTSTDLLREFSFGELPICRETVSDHLVNCLDFLTPASTLAQAQAMLEEAHTNCLPVMQGECPVGLVTHRQLRKTKLRQLLHEHAAETHQAGAPVFDSVLECMQKLEPVRPGQKLCSAATVMIEHSVQAVSVVNQAKRLMGVITEDKLLRLMFASLQQA